MSLMVISPPPLRRLAALALPAIPALPIGGSDTTERAEERPWLICWASSESDAWAGPWPTACSMPATGCASTTCRRKRPGPLVARGAELAASPAEVASAAEIVFMSLPTPDVVREVALGGNGGLINGSQGSHRHRPVDHGPRRGHRSCGKLAERKIAWVDSPVSGGVTGAKAGTLAVMVSCPEARLSEAGAGAEESSASCSMPARSRGWRRPPSSPTTFWPRRRMVATSEVDGDGRQGRASTPRC